MIPKDLLLLIDKYNEDGVAIDINDHVYWFNGKRFEYVAPVPIDHMRTHDVIYYNGSFYSCNPYTKEKYLFLLKGNKFVLIDKTFIETFRKYHPLKLFVNNENITQQFIIKNSKYRFKYDMSFINKIPKNGISHPLYRSRCIPIAYKNFIFVFELGGYFKFDCHTEQIVMSRPNSEQVPFNRVLFKDKIYFFKNENYLVYDIINDQWEELKLNLKIKLNLKSF